MEHHGNVWLNGDAGVVATGEGVLENVADAALAFAGPVVVGVVLGRVPSGVLDMDVCDMIANGEPEFPRILLGPGLRFGTIREENGVPGVEDPLKVGNFFQQFQRVLRAHATVIHAVLVNGLDAGVEEHLRHGADPLEDDGRCCVGVIIGLEAHHADVLRA